jgi:hypothetical protein
MSREKLLLYPGYRLCVGELMRPIALADNFTLGDLCQMLRDCHAARKNWPGHVRHARLY